MTWVGSARDILGGDEGYLARLEALFTAPIETTGRVQLDITGLMGQYAHGNEPSHHVAYLFIRRRCGDHGRKGGQVVRRHVQQPTRRVVWQRRLRPNERLVRVVRTSDVSRCARVGRTRVGLPPCSNAQSCLQKAEPMTQKSERVGCTKQANCITGMRWHDASGHSSPVLKRSFVPVADLIQGGTMELLMASRPDATFGMA